MLCAFILKGRPLKMVQALRIAWSRPDAGCSGCAWFRSDPASLQSAVPGVNIVAPLNGEQHPGHAACLLYWIAIDGNRRCAEHLPLEVGGPGQAR